MAGAYGDHTTGSLVPIESRRRGIGDDSEALDIALGEPRESRGDEALGVGGGEVSGVERAVLLIDDTIDDPERIVLGLDRGRLTHSRHRRALLLLFTILEGNLEGGSCSRGFGGLLAREGEDEDGFLRDLEGELPFLVGRRVRGVVELDRDRYLRQRRTSGVEYLPLDKDRLGTNGRHGADE